MSNPRFSMLNICSSLVLSFLCCFLWDSAKGGQVGLRENMLFSHTKNNHHNLITAFRNTSVSCFRVGICYCHRCAFCCSRSTKTHTKFHQFCQTGILWKSLASNMRVEGVSEFCGEIFRVPCGPEHASAEPCQGSPDGAPHSLLRPLHHPLHAGDSWLRGGDESFAVRAAGALCIIRGAQSAFSDPPWGCTGIPSRGSGWDPSAGHSCSRESHRTYIPMKPVCFHIYFATGVENLWQVVIDGTVLLRRQSKLPPESKQTAAQRGFLACFAKFYDFHQIDTLLIWETGLGAPTSNLFCPLLSHMLLLFI